MGKTAVIIGVFVVLGGALAVTFFGSNGQPMPNEMPKEQACTMEAKICPDGSAVGRTGPNCEFAACPQPPIVDPKCAPGYVLVGEGCIPAKVACELGGDQYYFDESQQKYLVR